MGEVCLNYCRSHSCADSNRVEDHDAKLRNRKDDSFQREKVYNGLAVARETQKVHSSRQQRGKSRKQKQL